ncbi:Uncharacterised protein [Escherichia coli]|uniref:Uncharacterized protein n=1 Tax=Escherichia coli TaxID=562 RepID=A0A376VWI7_ECOLX|nr:Uncharacterised protein [Escherichia coli]
MIRVFTPAFFCRPNVDTNSFDKHPQCRFAGQQPEQEKRQYRNNDWCWQEQ